MVKNYTVCIVHQNGKVLLGMKKKGFGTGRWNGFGGKVEDGETISHAAARELEEESGLKPNDLSEAGMLEFTFENDAKVLDVHFFAVTNFSGQVCESDEMIPKWFAVEEIPYDQMWTDDQYWLPLLLAGKKFKGKFVFDRPSDENYASKITSHELQII